MKIRSSSTRTAGPPRPLSRAHPPHASSGGCKATSFAVLMGEAAYPWLQSSQKAAGGRGLGPGLQFGMTLGAIPAPELRAGWAETSAAPRSQCSPWLLPYPILPLRHAYVVCLVSPPSESFVCSSASEPVSGELRQAPHTYDVMQSFILSTVKTAKLSTYRLKYQGQRQN